MTRLYDLSGTNSRDVAQICRQGNVTCVDKLRSVFLIISKPNELNIKCFYLLEVATCSSEISNR